MQMQTKFLENHIRMPNTLKELTDALTLLYNYRTLDHITFTYGM
jgi:hypothetical protein